MNTEMDPEPHPSSEPHHQDAYTSSTVRLSRQLVDSTEAESSEQLESPITYSASLLTIPPIWHYNQIYHPTSVDSLDRTKIFSPRDLELLQSVKRWNQINANQQTNQLVKETNTDEESSDWLSQTLIGSILPPRVNHESNETDRRPLPLKKDPSSSSSDAMDELPLMNSSDASSLSSKPSQSHLSSHHRTGRVHRGGRGPINTAERISSPQLTDDETTIGNLKPLEAEIKTRFGTPESVLHSFIIYFPEKIRAMRETSDREFQQDLLQAQALQRRVGQLLGAESSVSSSHPNSDGLSDAAAASILIGLAAYASTPCKLNISDTVPTSEVEIKEDQVWSTFYDRLCHGVEPTSEDKVILGEVELVLFLSWFLSDHVRHSIQARTVAAVSLIRLLLATPTTIDSTITKVKSAAPSPATIGVSSNRPVSSTSNTNDVFGPSVKDVVTMIKEHECVPRLPTDILHQMNTILRYYPAQGRSESKKFEEKMLDQHRDLNHYYVIGQLTTTERSMIRGSIMHFSLTHLDDILLSHLTTLIILLSHWDQLQSSWTTYFSSLAYSLTLFERPLDQAKKNDRQAYYAYHIMAECIHHHKMLTYDPAHVDPWYVYLQYVLVSSIGQRLLIPHESVDVVMRWMGEPGRGALFSNLAQWRHEGAIRLMTEASTIGGGDDASDSGVNPYDRLIPHCGPLKEFFLDRMYSDPARNPIELLVDLFLPLIIRTITFYFSPLGQARIDQLVVDFASPDRPKDAYGNQPSIRKHHEVEWRRIQEPLELYQGLLRQLHNQHQRMIKEKESTTKAISTASTGNVQSVLSDEQLKLVADQQKAADELKLRLDGASVKMKVACDRIWSLMRPRFLSTPNNASWYQLIGDSRDQLPSITNEQLTKCLSFDTKTFGLSTPDRLKQWSQMPSMEQLTCQQNLCASTHFVQNYPIGSEPFCLFLGRLGVSGGLIEGDGNGRPIYDPLSMSTGGVRLIQSTFLYDPDQSPRPTTQEELFACENILAFCRSYSAHSPLAVTLELAALKRAMESDSPLLRLIALTHLRSTQANGLLMGIPCRSRRTDSYEPFALTLQSHTDASITSLRTILNDVIQLPNVLTDLITQYYAPPTYAPLWNALPFLISCLHSNMIQVCNNVLAIFYNVPFSHMDDQSPTISPQQALSLPTLLIRPFFEQLLELVELEVKNEKSASITTSTTPIPSGLRKSKSPLLSLLLGRLNLGLPSSDPSHIPRGFLEPFMPRLTRVVLGEPTAETLTQLMSSPLFQRTIFMDLLLIERLDTLLLTPALLALEKDRQVISHNCAHGLGRRLDRDVDDDEDDEIDGHDWWDAMIKDMIPQAIKLPKPLEIFVKEVTHITHAQSMVDTDGQLAYNPNNPNLDQLSAPIPLAQFPSRVSELLSECAMARANQTRCFFLWLNTHERRIFSQDDEEASENANQEGMRDYSRELLNHVHSFLNHDGSDLTLLPADVHLWPTLLANDFCICIEIYATYEYTTPRVVIDQLLAGCSLHPKLARELIWPLFPTALKSWLKKESSEDWDNDYGYHAYNSLISIYWWAIESEVWKKVPWEVRLELTKAVPAIRERLLQPFESQTKRMKGLNSLTKLKEDIVKTSDSSPWKSMLAEAHVFFHHFHNQFASTASETTTASVSTTTSESTPISLSTSTPTSPDPGFILGWFHDEWVTRPMKSLTAQEKAKKCRRGQRRDEQPRLSDYSATLRMSLLEWYAEWMLTTRTHPKVQTLLADPISRTWLFELDRFIHSSPLQTEFLFNWWPKLIATLKPFHPQTNQVVPASDQKPIPIPIPMGNVIKKKEGTSQTVDAKEMILVATDMTVDPTSIPDGSHSHNPSLHPSTEFLTQLRLTLRDPSIMHRMDSHFRHWWDLKREPLDQRLTYPQQLLQPLLEIVQRQEFALLSQVATPLPRLITGLSRLLIDPTTITISDDSYQFAHTVCRTIITAMSLAFQTTIPLSDLVSSTSSIFDSLLLLTSLDSLPVTLSNLITESFSVLFDAPALHPSHHNWLDRLIATVPASSIRGEERYWLESPPWPEYQDALSAIPPPPPPLSPTTAITSLSSSSIAVNSSSSSDLNSVSVWLLPSSVTRFRSLACIWYRCFGRVDGQLIDKGQSMSALATILVYFTSFLKPSSMDGRIIHDLNFLLILFDRLNSHYLQWSKFIYDHADFRSAYPKIVESFQAFALSLTVMRSAPWSQLSQQASDEEISLSMVQSISANQLQWSSIDDALCDSFFTTLVWMPLSIDHSGKSDDYLRSYRFSRIFIPLYGAYLQRLAHRFRAVIEYEANHTFENDEPSTVMVHTIRRNGIAYLCHPHPLLFIDKFTTPTTTVTNGPTSESTNKPPSTPICSKCTRTLDDEVGRYGCVTCSYYICLDCGDPHALSNLLYASTRAMFMQLTTNWRGIAICGWKLIYQQILRMNSVTDWSNKGEYTKERLTHSFNWIRPIIPLMKPFLILTRRDPYAQVLLKSESHSSAYHVMSAEPSISIGLVDHHPNHSILFDQEPHNYSCIKCSQTYNTCSYWCPICDTHICIPCSEWSPSARHTHPAGLAHHRQLFHSIATKDSSVPPAFPDTTIASDKDGLFYGPGMWVVNDYLNLFGEAETVGPIRDAALNELIDQLNTQPTTSDELPPWQVLWSRAQIIHTFVRSTRLTIPDQLQTTFTRVMFECFRSDSLLVRTLGLRLMAPINASYRPETPHKDWAMDHHRNEFGSALIHLILTTPLSNSTIINSSVDALKSIDQLDHATLVNILISLCTRRTIVTALMVYLSTRLPPIFNSLIDSHATVGLVYAFVCRTMLILINARTMVRAYHAHVSFIGWRILPHGQTINHDRATLFSLILSAFESITTFKPLSVYSKLIQDLPPRTNLTDSMISMNAGASSIHPLVVLDESTLSLARKLITDETFNNSLLETIRVTLLTEGQFWSYETILKQESITVIGVPILGFSHESELIRQLAIFLSWSIGILPRLPFNSSGRSTFKPDIDLLFDLFNWSCTIPLLHSTIIAPNIELLLTSITLHLYPIFTEFESIGQTQSKLNPSTPQLIKTWFTNEIGHSPLNTLNDTTHVDHAASLLLQILAFGQTRQILIQSIYRSKKSQYDLRILIALFAPFLTYVESLLYDGHNHTMTHPFTLRPPKLGHFVHQLQMGLKNKLNDPLYPLMACTVPNLPHWKWYHILPTMSGMLIQLAQLDFILNDVDVIDSMLMDDYSTFRLRVERLWPIWGIILAATVPHPDISYPLMATYVRLNRIIPRTVSPDPRIQSTISLWSELVTSPKPIHHATVGSSSETDDECPAELFYASILLPAFNSVTWTNATTRKKLPQNVTECTSTTRVTTMTHHTTPTSTTSVVISSLDEFYQQLRRDVFADS